MRPIIPKINVSFINSAIFCKNYLKNQEKIPVFRDSKNRQQPGLFVIAPYDNFVCEIVKGEQLKFKTLNQLTFMLPLVREVEKRLAEP
ncbi:hypothetical protein [Niabella beijingensis]|uniref:hypothetical protein n=1 Tax=Niabella beijingensis TaxID=2872700 RepID=UPI001CBB513C|nr:hypothetical protein [Niabella beijingensis]MBZ4187508.1 hypothetical protein [Niabella beijingensis]